MRFLSLCALLSVLVNPGFGQDASNEKITEKLDAAKADYVEQINKAKEKLLAAIAKYEESISSNKSMDASLQIQTLDKIKTERDAFVLDFRDLPDIPDLNNTANTTFIRAKQRAESQCLKEFGIALDAFRARGDLDAVRAVLAEQETMFPPEPEPSFDGADKRFIDYCKKSMQENPNLLFCIVTNPYRDKVVRATARVYPRVPNGKHPEEPPPFPDRGLHRFDGELSKTAIEYALTLFQRHNQSRITKR